MVTNKYSFEITWLLIQIGESQERNNKEKSKEKE